MNTPGWIFIGRFVFSLVLSSVPGAGILVETSDLALLIGMLMLIVILSVALLVIFLHNRFQRKLYDRLLEAEREKIKTQEEKQETQKEHYRLTEALRASLNEIYLFDADNLQFQFVNDGALKNLGYSLNEMKAMTPLDIKPEMTRHEFSTILATLKDGESKIQTIETVHKRANGSTYPVEVYLQYIENPTDQVYLAVVQDVTEKKLIEKAVQLEQKRNRILVERSPEAIILTREGIVEYVNPAALRLFGARKATDLVGKLSLPRFTPEFHASIRERRKILLEDGLPVPLVEEKIIRMDGTICDVEVAAVAVGDIANKAIQVTLRDVTERKRTQEKLNEQLLELRRWHAVTLDREQRVLDLKAEVNALLEKAGEKPKYQITS